MDVLLWVALYALAGYIVAEFTFRLRKEVKQAAKEDLANKGVAVGKSAGLLTYLVYIALWPVVLLGGLYRLFRRPKGG